jgi:undecaprenyl-diphosphatase
VELARLALKFGNVDCIAVAVVVGVTMNYRREWFEKASCLVLFIVVFNSLLKNLFKVPLYPHLGTGYAFPSGHMHVATAFYGYFLYCAQNRLIKSLFIVILGLLGLAMVHHNFHNWFDISGTVIFATVEIVTLHFLQKRCHTKTLATISIVMIILSFGILQVFYKTEIYMWIAFCNFFCMLIGMKYCSKSILTTLKQKLVTLIITIGSMIILRRISIYSVTLLPAIMYCTIEVVSKFTNQKSQELS